VDVVGGFVETNLANKKGFLYKLSPSFFGGWQVSFVNFKKRYFILENKKLMYFKDDKESREPKGFINFDIVTT